jgi:hypothetical protein
MIIGYAANEKEAKELLALFLEAQSLGGRIVQVGDAGLSVIPPAVKPPSRSNPPKDFDEAVIAAYNLVIAGGRKKYTDQEKASILAKMEPFSQWVRDCFVVTKTIAKPKLGISITVATLLSVYKRYHRSEPDHVERFFYAVWEDLGTANLYGASMAATEARLAIESHPKTEQDKLDIIARVDFLYLDFKREMRAKE